MNKKLLILLTLTFSIIIPTYSFAFSDVSGHWAEETITKSSEYGIINGYVDDTFKPDEYMTRAELITVIDKLFGLESESDKYIPDISSKDWYYSNAKKAVFFGIIQGDENGNINANKNITREEAVLILTRAFKLKIDESNFFSNFDDENEISSWAKKELIAFARKQLIKGYEDNTIRPKNYITRAELMTLINRLANQVAKNDIQTQKINGNVIVKGKNISLNSMEIYGDLIIGENSANSIKLTNVIVTGNLILYAPIDFKTNTIAIKGETISAYENKAVSSLYYINEEYGISFPIPDGASTYNGMPQDKKDFSKQDLIVVNIQKNDENYVKNISQISKEAIKNLQYDSIFYLNTSGDINKYPYELYDDNASSHLLVIKRDNIVYTILFMNIVSNNLIDSVVSNIQFKGGLEVADNGIVVYKNAKLSLKFNYKNGYVGVDDSYNTNNVYSGDSIFKLFIQVNMITDMDEYSVEEIKSLLKTLIQNDGEITSEEIKKINTHDAIQFEIESEEDRIISLYVIIGNNLYNFIFKGNANAIDSVGKDMFLEIINSMEF